MKRWLRHLRAQDKGRLEQEFLPTDTVHRAVRTWVNDNDGRPENLFKAAQGFDKLSPNGYFPSSKRPNR